MDHRKLGVLSTEMVLGTSGVFDEGCGPIFSMNMTMGVKITCETLTNSPDVPPAANATDLNPMDIHNTTHLCS
jgi:hypothetical protein